MRNETTFLKWIPQTGGGPESPDRLYVLQMSSSIELLSTNKIDVFLLSDMHDGVPVDDIVDSFDAVARTASDLK